MTLEEAIKENKKMIGMEQGRGLARRIDALKLDIEALKRFQQLRADLDSDEYRLLPGETE